TPQANRILAAAMVGYAQFAEPFILRLPEYVRRIAGRWGVNMGEDCRALTRFVEEKVYRQIFSLNPICAEVNRLEVLAPEELPESEEIAAVDRKKAKALKQTRTVLDELTQRTGDFISKLRREL